MELSKILFISESYVFCVIEERLVYITNETISKVAKLKGLTIESISTLNYEEKIEFCEKNFSLEDLRQFKDGLLFYGTIYELHS